MQEITSPSAASKTDPLNFWICIVDSTCWAFGMAFFSLTTIVPLFLQHLHASNLEIGLLPAIVGVTYFGPGALVAKTISRLKLAKWWLFYDAILERVPLISIALLTLIIAPHSPSTMLVLTISLFALHGIFHGLNQPAYWVVIGKGFPVKQRGRLYGWAGVAGGLTALTIDPLSRHFLSRGGIANFSGFYDCFLLGAIVLFIGPIGFALFREPAQETVIDDLHQGHFLQDAVVFWRGNRSFRYLVYSQCMISTAAMAQSFFVLAYSNGHTTSGNQIADFTSIGAVLGAFGSLGWGMWADSHGNKRVLMTASIFTLIAMILAFCFRTEFIYYLIFTASALGATGIAIAGNNIVLEFTNDVSEIPFLLSIFNLLTLPFKAFAPLVGGLMADHVGYSWVFAVSAVAAVAALVFTVRIVEPRKKQL